MRRDETIGKKIEREISDFEAIVDFEVVTISTRLLREILFTHARDAHLRGYRDGHSAGSGGLECDPSESARREGLIGAKAL